MDMSYKKLEIWQLARELVIKVHKMSLQLPQFETESFKFKSEFEALSEKLDLLGKKLTRFIQSVEKQHNELNEDVVIYQASSIKDQVSN